MTTCTIASRGMRSNARQDEATKERTTKQGEKGKRERWKDGGGVGAVFFHVFNFFSAKHFIQKPLFHFFASFLQNYP